VLLLPAEELVPFCSGDTVIIDVEPDTVDAGVAVTFCGAPVEDVCENEVPPRVLDVSAVVKMEAWVVALTVVLVELAPAAIPEVNVIVPTDCGLEVAEPGADGAT
jgi:hypothetical protein